MSNYVKVNGLYLSDYNKVVGPDGKDYLVDLVFTKDVKLAADVPHFYMTRMLMSIRKKLRLSGDSTDYLYEISSIDGVKDLPVNNVATSLDMTKTVVSPAPLDKSSIKVDIDLDWLVGYMLSKGLSNIQLALDMGLEGKRVYYGVKIVKGKLKATLENVETFAKKHPAIRNHYTVCK